MINDDILIKLEKLSYIKIDSSEKETIKSEMNDMLEFAKNLDQLNISDSSEMNKNTLRLRDDKIVGSNVGESILEHAPKEKDNFFIVPKVIE